MNTWLLQMSFHFCDYPNVLYVSGETANEPEVWINHQVTDEETLSETLGTLYWDGSHYYATATIQGDHIDRDHWLAAGGEWSEFNKVVWFSLGTKFKRLEEAVEAIAAWFFVDRAAVLAENRLSNATMLDFVPEAT